jgi:hypothetical protein
MAIGLEEALRDISAIRQLMARTEQFRGYRAVPTALSGLFAIVAGLVQSIWIAEPKEQLGRYLMLWIGVAAASQVVCLGDLWRRYQSSKVRLHQEATRLAVGQFYPCVVVGALLTVVIVRSVPDAVGMLPGLWSVLFSLGLFASLRLLPPALIGAACYYMAAGLYAISLGSSPFALGPWTMPLLFGIGQLLTSIVLLQSEREGEGDAV